MKSFGLAEVDWRKKLWGAKKPGTTSMELMRNSTLQGLMVKENNQPHVPEGLISSYTTDISTFYPFIATLLMFLKRPVVISVLH